MAPPRRRLTVHRAVLSAAQTRVLGRLAPLMAGRDFYLAGGTALALQLGHRRSVDFDWFTVERLAEPLRLARTLQDALPLQVEAIERGTLHATISGVRVSFLEYRYPLLRPLVAIRAPAVRLASLEDIACMKLAAVAQRGSRKDFLDLYALGQSMTLPRMLDLYRRKYGIADPGHVLFALAYFDDAEKERMPVLLKPCSWTSVKQAIRGWVRDIASTSR